jgi:hypothetical protein
LRRFGNKSRKAVRLKHNRRERGPHHEHKQQRSPEAAGQSPTSINPSPLLISPFFVGGSLGRSVAPGGGLASADSSRYAAAGRPSEGTTIYARILSSSTIPLDDCSAIKSRQDVFEGAINVIG